MDTQNPSAPSRAQSAADGNPSRTRHRGGGIVHENTRHTTRFVVIGNHLVQHPELSLLAIGLGCHIQSLPAGAGADIKSLAARFPEGPTRITAALRELEAHGYLRRERVRTSTGRIVTRTVSCNQPQHRREAADTGCQEQATLKALTTALRDAPEDVADPIVEFTAQGLGNRPAKHLWRKLVAVDLSFYKSYISEEIRDEGRAQGRAEDVLLVLEQRGLDISDAVRTRVTECGDPNLLRHWLARAVTAPKAEAIFEGE